MSEPVAGSERTRFVVGTVGGGLAGLFLGAIVGPTAALAVGMLGAVLGHEYERRSRSGSPTDS